jgi:hypothetical protein
MREFLTVPLFGLLLVASRECDAADDAEDQAVAAIKKLGGAIERHPDKPDGPVTFVSLSGVNNVKEVLRLFRF